MVILLIKHLQNSFIRLYTYIFFPIATTRGGQLAIFFCQLRNGNKTRSWKWKQPRCVYQNKQGGKITVYYLIWSPIFVLVTMIFTVTSTITAIACFCSLLIFLQYLEKDSLNPQLISLESEGCFPSLRQWFGLNICAIRALFLLTSRITSARNPIACASCIIKVSNKSCNPCCEFVGEFDGCRCQCTSEQRCHVIILRSTLPLHVKLTYASCASI